ncbi:DNA primase large subunit-like [Bombus bifarius]|uniref:DNA primase large subunit n=1 Tax=Bombus bifarius TaxID=103933 RepID=A0A6P8NWZ2_9HYME|nr:DNA primase large subunit-like [Bombus vancouverensis nearcticus]XP_033318780.1 DNA primase large subunit-like [Bombus bifarius]
MEYTKRRRYAIKVKSNDLEDIYPHDLQMYDFPPRGEVLLTEFEQLAKERLRLLLHIENNANRTDFKTLEERKQNLNTALTKDGLKYYAHLLYAKGCKTPTETDLQYRRKDHISHFILRLSHCFEPDNQTWFINQEVEFFKLRFNSLDKEGVEKLLSMHKIDCQQITPEEKDELREELGSSTAKVKNVDMTEFYKVPFQKVTDLIRSRRVYLNQGIAFIPQTDLVSLFVSCFRKNLVDGMPDARMSVGRMYGDERIASCLKSVHNVSERTTVLWTSAATPIDKLDELSKTSYPLCMRVLHEALRTHHHLKNSGRIQYGLFIKGIGVTLEDALSFWKTEFTKKIDPGKFDKEYAYTIRHTYGKEGKQTNYTPLGCTKIISSAVSAGEYHGCPFKHMDQGSLRQKLFNYGVTAASINEITDLAKEQNYFGACTAYFEFIHDRLPDKPINHPNVYFMESRAILSKDNAAEPENKERLSQSGRHNIGSPGIGTPRNMDRNVSTPLRSAMTPSRSIDKGSTPSRRMARMNSTPTRAARPTPKRIENHLNDDDIAQLMSEDM